MDWDHLRTFLSVARNGQLLAAGRKLGVNHATVGRRLDALEAHLGVKLFIRRPTGSMLTQSGERLLPIAERIETQVLETIENFQNEGAEVSGTVRVGVPDGVGTYFLAAELASLAQLHPDLVVELVPLPRTFSISRREADLAISLEQPTEGRLVVVRLTDYTLSVYASREYLSRRGTPRRVQDLDIHTVVASVDDFAYASALDYTTTLEQHAGGIFRCASVAGQIETVRAGRGIAVLHDFAAATAPNLISILPSIKFRRSYFLFSHPETAEVRRIAACRDFITRRVREERRRFIKR
jgi:DNA-binding transcriptional LysR family regulator